MINLSDELIEELLVPKRLGDSTLEEWLWVSVEKKRWTDPDIHQRFSSNAVDRIGQLNKIPHRGWGRLTPSMFFFYHVVPAEIRSSDVFSDPEIFCSWYVSEGIRELRTADFASQSQAKFLLEPHPDFPALSRFWFDAWMSRPDLQATFSLKNEQSLSLFKRWIVMSGANEYRAYRFISEDIICTLNDARGLIEGDGANLPGYYQTILHERADVYTAYSNVPRDNKIRWFSQWFQNYGARETGFQYYPATLRLSLWEALGRYD